MGATNKNKTNLKCPSNALLASGKSIIIIFILFISISDSNCDSSNDDYTLNIHSIDGNIAIENQSDNVTIAATHDKLSPMMVLPLIKLQTELELVKDIANRSLLNENNCVLCDDDDGGNRPLNVNCINCQRHEIVINQSVDESSSSSSNNYRDNWINEDNFNYSNNNDLNNDSENIRLKRNENVNVLTSITKTTTKRSDTSTTHKTAMDFLITDDSENSPSSSNNVSEFMINNGNFDIYDNGSCTDDSCINHNLTCLGDQLYCNYTYEEYVEMLYDYIYPTVPEWILIFSHAVVFFMGLVSETFQYHF